MHRRRRVRAIGQRIEHEIGQSKAREVLEFTFGEDGGVAHGARASLRRLTTARHFPRRAKARFP